MFTTGTSTARMKSSAFQTENLTLNDTTHLIDLLRLSRV